MKMKTVSLWKCLMRKEKSIMISESRAKDLKFGRKLLLVLFLYCLGGAAGFTCQPPVFVVL